MMGNLGLGEILAIVVVVLLLFGARRIPEVARGIGRGLREFKAALSGELPDEKASGKETPAQKTGGA